jgi:cell division septation protein DedD
MTEKDDFGFEEQPEPVEQDPGDALIEEELRWDLGESAAVEAVEKRSPGRMILLLVLLLVLAGAAAYFFLGSPPVPETPPPAPPVRQPIALPPPPVNTEDAMVKTETVPPVPPSVEAPAAPGKPEALVKAEVPAVKAAVPAKAEEPTARAAAPPSPPPAGQAVAPAKIASPKAGPYFLHAGAFLLKANLRAAEAQVRRLGYEPRVKSMRKTVPMTRLRVGAFFAEEGKAKLDSLKAVAPNAFLIRQGEYVLVYAGSYQDLDRARRAADHLYQQGIRVEEEPVVAEVSLSLLSFGAFADRNAAEQAAVRARAAGLEAIVRKDP